MQIIPSFSGMQLVLLVAALLSVVLLFRTARKLLHEQPATFRAPLLAILWTTGITLVYMTQSHTPFNQFLGSWMWLVGVCLGIVQGARVQFYFRGRQLISRNGGASLTLWAVTYGAAVLLPLLGSTVLHAAALLALQLAFGATLGANMVLLVRRLVTRPPRVPAGSQAGAVMG